METGVMPCTKHQLARPKGPAYLDDKIKETHFVITSDRCVWTSDRLTIDHSREVHVFACSARGRGGVVGGVINTGARCY